MFPSATVVTVGPLISGASSVTLTTLGTVNNVQILEAVNHSTSDVQLLASTSTGTTLLHDFGIGTTSLAALGTLSNSLVFEAVNSRTGDTQVWGTTGTAAGTTLLHDFNFGIEGAGLT
ncbi:MAG TPA: hypothetical protein VMF30_16560, partial [Pirellulales bacterium]|nr:hypothetical protein [Pirellulales bacterium]